MVPVVAYITGALFILIVKVTVRLKIPAVLIIILWRKSVTRDFQHLPIFCEIIGGISQNTSMTDFLFKSIYCYP